MRIGIIYAGAYPYGIGASQRITLIARMMMREKASPTVLVPFPYPFPHVPSAREGVSEEGIPYQYLTLRTRRQGWKKAVDHLQYALTVRGALRRAAAQFDAFYVYGFTPYLMRPVLQTLEVSGTPFVIEFSELRSTLLNPARSFKERILHRWAARLERCLPPAVRGLVLISEALEQFYRPLFSGPLLRLPIIADYSRFAPVPMDRPPTYRIGYMGGFSEKDGIDGILRSFLRLHAEMPQVRLSLIGYSPNLPRIQRWLGRYGLTDAVDFHINAPYSALPDVLSACDTLVMNRIDIPASHYGFPTKVSEYLATGVPVIATRVSDLPLYLTHERDVFFIPPNDEKALVSALRRRYVEYERFQRIGRSGWETGFQHFHYERHLGTIRKVIELLRA